MTRPSPVPDVTAAATFCATLVDEWVRSGCTGAFVAPGSRSTPLALALAERPEVTVSVFHDERAAAFAALGWALQTGRPAIVLCSSGTAGAHFHAAVIEASLSSVPLIVVTADRPPELWDVGAPQTIDQTHLFGGAVRWFAEPGVPDDSQAPTWRSWGSRAVAEARGGTTGARPGPVHLNLSFRDPLAGSAGAMPPGRPDGHPWHRITAEAASATVPATASVPAPRSGSGPTGSGLAGIELAGRAGVIVAGGGVGDPAAVVELGRRLGWPVLADHRSGCRRAGFAIAHFDGILRHAGFAERHRPDVVLRFGEPPASKVLNRWVADSGAELIVAAPGGRWLDPDRHASVLVPDRGAAAALLAGLTPAALPTGAGSEWAGSEWAGSEWADAWQEADRAAAAAIEACLAEAPVNDVSVSRAVLAALPSGSALVVASSMTVRELEWFGAGRDDVTVHANRGANGIDGTVATAIGVATTGVPTTCLVGDVAFLHDATALTGLSRRDIDLSIVVLDNDGGAIFGFLPQHEQVPADRFELLFGTPHGTDLEALARAHQLTSGPWEGLDPLPSGVRVVVARTDREATLGLHRALNERIVAALT